MPPLGTRARGDVGRFRAEGRTCTRICCRCSCAARRRYVERCSCVVGARTRLDSGSPRWQVSRVRACIDPCFPLWTFLPGRWLRTPWGIRLGNRFSKGFASGLGSGLGNWFTNGLRNGIPTGLRNSLSTGLGSRVGKRSRNGSGHGSTSRRRHRGTGCRRCSRPLVVVLRSPPADAPARALAPVARSRHRARTPRTGREPVPIAGASRVTGATCAGSGAGIVCGTRAALAAVLPPVRAFRRARGAHRTRGRGEAVVEGVGCGRRTRVVGGVVVQLPPPVVLVTGGPSPLLTHAPIVHRAGRMKTGHPQIASWLTASDCMPSDVLHTTVTKGVKVAGRFHPPRENRPATGVTRAHIPCAPLRASRVRITSLGDLGARHGDRPSGSARRSRRSAVDFRG